MPGISQALFWDFFFEIVNVEFNFSVIKTKKIAADLSPCIVILT